MQIHLNFSIACMLVLFTIMSATAQVRFGAKAGLNMANMSYSEDYSTDLQNIAEGTITNSIIPAFHAGGLVEFDFGAGMGLSAGLQLSVKGERNKYNGGLVPEFSYTQKIRPVYVQVPVAVYYRNSGFYAGAGPYIGYGVAGKVKTKRSGEENEESEDIKFDNKNGQPYDSAYFSPLDFGAGLEVGYEFGSIRVSASYNLGLANVFSKNAVDWGGITKREYKCTHHVIGVSVAYLFRGE